MVSPRAAASEWVQREIEWWLTNRSRDRLLILVTEGEVRWDAKEADFDWGATTALPRVLQGKFSDEPLYVDLRSAGQSFELTLRHTKFRAAMLRIAAPIHGLPMDEMDGEAVRTYKKNMASAAVLMVGLAAALVTATWQWRVATVAKDEALKETKLAQSRELASYANSLLPIDPQLSLNLAVRASLKWKTTEAETILRKALAVANSAPTAQIARVGGAGDRLVALSPQAKYGATRNDSGHFSIWRLPPEPTRIASNREVAATPLFSQDETLVATRTSDGLLTVRTIADTQEISTFDGVQTAAFAGAGLTILQAGGRHQTYLMLWDPEARKPTWRSVKAPEGVLAATFIKGADALYATVDAYQLDVWNAYQPFSDVNGPQSRYTFSHTTTAAWFNEPGNFVLATNVYDSAVIDAVTAQLVSRLSIGSLRTAAFSHDSEFLLAVPQAG